MSSTNINGKWRWIVVLLVIHMLSIAVAWGATGQRIKNTEDDMMEVKTEIKEMKIDIGKIDKKVDRIQILQEIDLRSRGIEVPE